MTFVGMMGLRDRLGNYIKEYSERNRRLEDIPVYSVTNTQGFCTDFFGKEVASKDKSTYKIVPRGCFAYNPSRINVGSIDWQRVEDRVIVSPLYVVFSVSKDVLPQYLFYYLKSDIALAYIKTNAAGSVRDNLKFSALSDFPFPLRSMSDQQLIANRLDKVKRIISMRQQQLSAFDDLVKARFVEMFGDPLRNNKEFETRAGSEIFKLSNGKFVPESKRLGSGVPVYGGNGISWFTDDVLFENDTIVIGRVGFQSGNVHLVEGPLWISDNAMYISDFLDDGYDLHFLHSMMEHIDFTRFQDAGDLKKITQKPFMQMQYIRPPISIQRDYNVFAAQVDKSKSVIQKSLAETQTLFDSLMQEYFG